MRFALTEGRWRGDRGKAYEETTPRNAAAWDALTPYLEPRAPGHASLPRVCTRGYSTKARSRKLLPQGIRCDR